MDTWEITADEVIRRAKARRALSITPALARSMRHQAGLTQREVGQVLGVSSVAVCRWEAGARLPRGDLARRYLDFLNRACRETAP